MAVAAALMFVTVLVGFVQRFDRQGPGRAGPGRGTAPQRPPAGVN
jgi:hypothetical protein